MVMDYYLTIRQWKTNLDPESATMKQISVWITFPGFSIEGYDEDFLLNLESQIDKIMRVEAILCQHLEVYMLEYLDLTQPLLSKSCLR